MGREEERKTLRERMEKRRLNEKKSVWVVFLCDSCRRNDTVMSKRERRSRGKWSNALLSLFQQTFLCLSLGWSRRDESALLIGARIGYGIISYFFPSLDTKEMKYFLPYLCILCIVLCDTTYLESVLAMASQSQASHPQLQSSNSNPMRLY